MIKFTTQEIEILKNNFEEEINSMTEGIKEDFESLYNGFDNDSSVFSSLTMAYYLLNNIDKLDDPFYFNLLKLYIVKLDIWYMCDEELHDKCYSKEENDLFNKIINYNIN